MNSPDYAAAAHFIEQVTPLRPQIALVLGSGMGEFAERIQDAEIIDTEQIPGWPRSTVEGHRGRLVIGQLGGKTVLVQQGRIHFYEGYTPQQVVFPVRAMHHFGIKTLILTNAAGGINPAFATGVLMLMQDHISFPGLSGYNPLIGPNDATFGPRFPDMTTIYDAELRALAKRTAAEQNVTLHEGVYACVSGPSYETPAEIRMLRTIGADAVGMSTAPEATAARHAGMRVMGISGISNMAHDSNDPSRKVSHEDVLNISTNTLNPMLNRLLTAFVSALAE